MEPRLRTLCHVGVMLNYVIKYFKHFHINLSKSELEQKKRICLEAILNDIREQPIKFRSKVGTDYGNGVIGFAWCLEYFLSEKFLNGIEVEKLKEFNNLIKNFPWDNQQKQVKLQKSDRTRDRETDPTFNHQLWAISTLLYFQEEKKIQDMVNGFISNNKPQLYRDSILYHKSKGRSKKGFKELLRLIKYYPKSVSYHYFNVVALRRFPSYFFNKKDACISFAKIFSSKLKWYHVPIVLIEKHGMRYNPVGFETMTTHNRGSNYVLLRLQLLILKLALRYKGSDMFCDRSRLISRAYEILLQ